MLNKMMKKLKGGAHQDPKNSPIHDKDSDSIRVHHQSVYPTRFWTEHNFLGKYDMHKVAIEDLVTEDTRNKIRVVCISDTHCKHRFSIPEGDILIHSGDFTNVGTVAEVKLFNEFLGSQPFKHKVVIAGNHDMSFDDEFIQKLSVRGGSFGLLNTTTLKEELEELGISHVKEMLTNCTYLEDSAVQLYGWKIYGSPWQPEFCNWGFNLERGQACLDKWNMIPKDTDILVTHGPPIGHGDLCDGCQRAGCVDLLHTIMYRVKPQYHVFGHVHEGYGVTSNGTTTFINASTCSIRYQPVQPPIVFDIVPKSCDDES